MTLEEQMRSRIKTAMREHREVEKSILRLALGELQTAQTRGGEFTEAQAEKILRKLMASNTETMAARPEADHSRLEEENAILDSLLPKMWDLEQVKQFLGAEDTLAAIKAAPNDGAATGAAMKAIKPAGAPVDGKTVSQAVRELRA